MKKEILSTLLIGAVGMALLTGCVRTHRTVVAEPTRRVVVVTETPPEPRPEVIGRAPDASHVWVPGYWSHTGRRWVWVPGHWEVRPRTGAAWVPGKWDKNPDGRGWVWTPGRWE